MTLREVLAEAAATFEDVTRSEPDSGPGITAPITWTRAGTAFAILEPGGGVVEFALDPAVATAATRTPDVARSERGPGWIRFAPATLDGHAVDRATAWFASAARRTGNGSRPTH